MKKELSLPLTHILSPDKKLNACLPTIRCNFYTEEKNLKKEEEKIERTSLDEGQRERSRTLLR